MEGKLFADESYLRKLEEGYLQTMADFSSFDSGIKGVMDIFDSKGDLGVGQFANLSVETLKRLLGIKNDQPFPFLVETLSDLGVATGDKEKSSEEFVQPFEPRWHQFVGVCAIVQRMYKGENVLLADGVGVGKTLQALMLIAYLRYLRIKVSHDAPPKKPLFGMSDFALSLSSPRCGTDKAGSACSDG